MGEEGSPRVPVDVNAAPWSAIGKIFNSTGAACTGALIGPKTVLTAAHCLYNFRTARFLQPTSIHFLLGYEKGAFRSHHRVDRYTTGFGYDPARERETVGSDWAVLTLKESVSDVVALRLAPDRPREGSRVSLAGYGRERAYVLTADPDCRILQADPSALFSTNCKALPGDSGGPILSKGSDSSYLIVGVQVVTAKLRTHPGNPVAIAVSSSVVSHGGAQ
jgi:protease YdgD